MKKILSFRKSTKKGDNKQHGNDQSGIRSNSLLTRNTFNTHEEQHLKSVEEVKPQSLAELLGVAPDADTSEEDLIQRYVSQHFPKAAADLNQNLEQHLLGLQETVHKELVRLGTPLKSKGLMGCLAECYQRQTFDHLSYLLQNISSSQNSFVLMNWVLHTNLSKELLGHTELQEIDPKKEVNFWLSTEWVEKAKEKLLENVRKDIREYLEKILQNEESEEGCDHDEEGCDHDEPYIRLYVDTIQCIDAAIQEARKIPINLSDEVQEVCFQELQIFLRRYTAEQKEILGKKVKMDKPETIHFFKTLKTCKELKEHVQTKGKGIKESLFQETVELLEEMETFTLNHLIEIVANIAESNLSKYFNIQNKQFFLIHTIETHFTKLPWCQDVQKSVMDKAYKRIVHIYLKHLIQSSQSKLKKRWSPNVGERVTADAELLHDTISELAPDVQQWNLLLLKVTELMECKDLDSVKLIVASMPEECLTRSKDLELLPTLLRWTGLSGKKVREVLDAISEGQPRPRPWYSCVTCW